MNTRLQKTNIIVMLIATLLFVAGYHLVYATEINVLRDVRIISNSALLGLCLFGSVFMLSDSQNTRSQKILALQILLVALVSALTLTRIVTQDNLTTALSQLLSPNILLYGNTCAFILLIYPFELLCPKQKILWRYTKLFLPLFIMIIIYFAYTSLSGLNMTEVNNWQNLGLNLYKLDVLLRLAFLVYPVWIFMVIMRQKKRYINWCCANGSRNSYINLCGLNYYLFGYSIILVSLIVAMLLHNYQSLSMHNFTLLVFFCAIFHTILRHKDTTLSEDRDRINHTAIKHKLWRERQLIEPEDIAEDKYRFVDKIAQYKSDLEKWMQEQQPYKDKDFKLLDVMQVLPLNRSYISQLFNDGYGETFFNFVMRYRIDESVRLLETHPEMNIRRISDMCGFSSPSVFGRAFLKNKGTTPKQYRIDRGISEVNRESLP